MAVSTPQRSAAGVVAKMRRPAGRGLKERLFHYALIVATAVGVVVLATLLIDTFRDGLSSLSLHRLTNYSSRFPDQYGYVAGITGTLSLITLVAGLGFPIGLGAAIYLEEFAPDNWFTRLMQINIANLAGVPSVVYGLLASGVFVYYLGLGSSLLAGALALTLLVLPVIIVAAREALRAVPQSIREAGLALGATPWEVTSRQVLPVALPGALTGTILALSRAIGEAAPILVVGAALSRGDINTPWNLLERFVALPVQIFNLVSRPQPEFQTQVAAAGIIVLLAALLLMNATAIVLRNRYSRRW